MQYSIYMKNFWYTPSSGNRYIVNTKQLVYTVPITNPEYAFVDPVVKCEMGKAGSFEFTVYPNHPYFDAWRQLHTILYVEYDGTTIFHGRVLTIDNSPLKGSRKIHCEGDLAFLLDSYQPMTKEETRQSISLNSYITQILNRHRSQMYISGDDSYTNPDADKTDKAIFPGEIPGRYSGSVEAAQRISNASEKFGSKSWESSMNALEALQKSYGGYFRTRYITNSSGGSEYDVCYLDWFESYFRNDPNLETIEVTKNLIDLNSSSEVDNIFTVLVPIGSNEGKDVYLDGYKYRGSYTWHGKYITVSDLDRLCSEGVISESRLNVGYHSRADYRDSINNYGYIYKTQKFENADTQEKLFNYAVDWIINNYIGGLTSFSVSALDLHHYNPAVYTTKYLAGDRVTISYPDPKTMTGGAPTRIDKTLTIISAEYHLHDPKSDSYSIGTPNSILEKTYGTAKKTKSASSAKRETTNDTAKKEIESDMGDVDETLWSVVINTYYNHDQYPELDPTETKAIMKMQYLFLKQASDNPKGSAGLLLDGLTGKIQFDADNPLDEKKALKKMEMYGDNFKYIRYLADGTAVVGFKVEQDADGYFGMDASKVLLGQDAEGNKVAINLDGLGGLMSLFGIDGTSEEMFKSIDISGFQQFMKFFNKSGDETVKTTGEDGSTVYGTDTVNAETGVPNWDIGINRTLRYKDKDGVWHTIDKQNISAKDFYLPEVPSFKSEFAYINNLLADYVETKKLVVSDTAWITNIQNENASVKYNLYANNIGASSISATTITAGTGGVISNQLYYKTTGMGNVDMVTHIWASMQFTTKSDQPGKIFLQGKPYSNQLGPWVDIANFNIADTQFYKDAVSAAWNDGGATAHFVCSTSSTTLEPGGSVDLYAYYMDDSSPAVPVRSYYSGTGRYSSRTISARNLRLRQVQTAVRPTTSNQTVPIGSDSGGVPYDGLDSLVVEGSPNLVQENIKKGVSIFGVPGSYEVPLQESKTIYPTGSTQSDIGPDSGYSGFKKVTVGAVVYSGLSKDTIKSGTTVTIGSTNDTDSVASIAGEYDPSPTAWNNGGATAYFTATRTSLNPGQSSSLYAYYTNYDGNQAMSSVSGQGKYSSLTISAATDQNLVQENIKDGVTIFDVTGNYTGSGSSTPSKVEIWYADGSGKVPSRNISSAISMKPWCLINNTWYDGDEITLTPTGGGGGGHNNPIEFTRASSPEDPGGHSYKYTAIVGDNITGNAQKFTFYY